MTHIIKDYQFEKNGYRKFDIVGNKAYAADGSGGLQIIDISNATNPVIIGSVKMPDQTRDVKVIGNTAYVADWASGVQVIDVSTQASQLLSVQPIQRGLFITHLTQLKKIITV